MFIAAALGIVFTSAAFAWEIGNDIKVEKIITQNDQDEIEKVIYKVHGPLFFASAQKFMTFFNPKSDPDIIEIDFQ